MNDLPFYAQTIPTNLNNGENKMKATGIVRRIDDLGRASRVAYSNPP